MSLTRKQLIDLAASLHDRWTLSVYIDATTADPAARAAWKTTVPSGECFARAVPHTPVSCCPGAMFTTHDLTLLLQAGSGNAS